MKQDTSVEEQLQKMSEDLWKIMQTCKIVALDIKNTPDNRLNAMNVLETAEKKYPCFVFEGVVSIAAGELKLPGEKGPVIQPIGFMKRGEA